MKKILLLAAVLCAAPTTAHAFCGFYVNGAGGAMYNDATEVVMMRMGTRTVLSMQNSYQGPLGDFAMVVPVPVVLHKEDVKTLNKEVFDKVDTMGSPRLVEYWEQDPCNQDDESGGTGNAMALDEGKMGKKDSDRADGQYHVKIEAQFVVGEYEIVVLSAQDSTGLDSWLRDNGYKIPDGAEPLLRPYVEAGSKFFVAKVDPKKVTFDSEGHAVLSPLRFDYDADDFTLPIRLGLAASPGKQDLIVNILSPEGRFVTSNYKNVTIPTNLDVKDETRNRFAEFYAALFDRTIEKNPGAVITEYAWAAGSCDPCPGPTLDYQDFAVLGADVVDKGQPYQGYDMTLTRLHARYGKDGVPDDLVFAKAKPIVGGREFVVDPKTGKLEEGAHEDEYQNNFQGRYIIRHEWTGPLTCKDPVRGVWGGPPGDRYGDSITAGKDLAHAPRGSVQVAQFVKKDVPEIDVKASGAAPPSATRAPSGAREPSNGPTPYGQGCCDTSSGGGGFVVLGFATLLLIRRRHAS